LPFPDETFSIVTARFAFHHFPDPFAALLEMRRVCKTGGRVVVADSCPAPEKAAAFNAMERLRDPSHVRALAESEHSAMFIRANFREPAIDRYRLEGELEELLSRSFPSDGDANRIRQIFADSLSSDFLDMATERRDGKIYFSFPVAIFADRKV